MVSHPKSQHFFLNFFDFFSKSGFQGGKKVRKPLILAGFRTFKFLKKISDFSSKKVLFGADFEIFCKKIFFSHK